MKVQELDMMIKANHCEMCIIKPCQSGCPLQLDIPVFINLIKKQKYEEGYEFLVESNVLQKGCGSHCPYDMQCQSSCAKGVSYEPVQIAKLVDHIIAKAKKIG